MIRTVGIKALAGLALAALIVVGCDLPRPADPPVRVAAASDLQEAMPVLASAFKLDKQLDVVPTFGASGQLAEQVRQGAPFDIYFSADKAYVERLASEGHVRADSVKPYARGTLVLGVNSIFGLKIKALDDLKDPKIKAIAIANPETAPYGRAAKQALERSGLWEELKAKIIPAESVRQAMQFVQSGNAEVGFVSRSLARTPGIEAVLVPGEIYDPIIQYLGVVANGRTAEGDAFAAFVLGPTGQGILRDMGFSRPPEKP